MTPRAIGPLVFCVLLLLSVTRFGYAEQLSVTSSGKVVGISPGRNHGPQRIDFLLLQPLEIVVGSFLLVKDRGDNVLYGRVRHWDSARKTLSVESVRNYGSKSAIQLSRQYDLVLRVESRSASRAEPPVRLSPVAEESFSARSDRRWFVDLSYGDPISEQMLNIHAGHHFAPFLSGYLAYGYYSESVPGGSASLSDGEAGFRVLVPRWRTSPFVCVNYHFLKVSGKRDDESEERNYTYSPIGIGLGGEWQSLTGLRLAAGFTLFVARGTLSESVWASSALSVRMGWAL